MESLINMNVDGIMTDDADYLKMYAQSKFILISVQAIKQSVQVQKEQED